MLNINFLPTTEYSLYFFQYMLNRMGVSFHKYGSVAEGFPSKINAIASMEQRIEKYKETGNSEWLVDAANFAMIEFMHPQHPNAHFEGTDSAASPGRITATGQRTKKSNEDL